MNTNQLYDLFLKCNGVSTDTRSIKKNSLFFSLKGENFDGNDYALEALNKGAKYAVIDNNKLKNSKRRSISFKHVTVSLFTKTMDTIPRYTSKTVVWT